MQLEDVSRHLLHLDATTPTDRTIVAIAGAPASGKSTLAAKLEALTNEIAHLECAIVLPMDGFHLDNELLDQDHTRRRKGSAPTFDFDGFYHMLQRVAHGKYEVLIPTFDRKLDLARAGARRVLPQHTIILVEGNYLLLDQEPWQQLHTLFNYRIFLEVPEAILTQRLHQRWVDHDFTSEQAMVKAQSNDIPNARLVMNHRLSADLVIKDCGQESPAL